eukprot:g15011.t1
MYYERRALVSGPFGVVADVSACLARAFLKSFTPDNMSYAYATKEQSNLRFSAENNRTLPFYDLRYTESAIDKAGLVQTTSAALKVSLPKPIPKEVVPSLEQELLPTMDQKEIPILLPGADLYFYGPQPNLEQPRVKLQFRLKDVEVMDRFSTASGFGASFSDATGTTGLASCAHVSLRCRVLGSIRDRVVGRLLDPLMNDYGRVGSSGGLSTIASGMEFLFEGFPNQMELMMQTEVEKLESELKDVGETSAQDHADRYKRVLMRQATSAGSNLDALWEDFESYLSEESGRRRFRMTSLLLGNLALETAQHLEQSMRELLTTARLSLVDPGTTIGASKFAFQDHLLQLENEKENRKQIEMRVANPVPKDKNHATIVTLQFGVPESVEEEVLLYLIAPVAWDETYEFLMAKKGFGNNVDAAFFGPHLGVWEHSVLLQGDKLNPDEAVRYIHLNNRRIREALWNLTETEILQKARVLLKALRTPFESVSGLYDYALGDYGDIDFCCVFPNGSSGRRREGLT